MTGDASTAARLAPALAQLRARRRDLKVSQEALAGELEVSALAVSAWERGLDIPATENFLRWAEALGHVLRAEGRPDAPFLAPRPGEPIDAFRLRCVARTLASAREARDWTQDMVGERLGVSAWTVHMWETSHRVPRLARLLAWSDAVGCRLVLADAGPPRPPRTPRGAPAAKDPRPRTAAILAL